MKIRIPEGYNVKPVYPKSVFLSVFETAIAGLEEHARALLECGVETIYASSGTAAYLKGCGVPVIDFNQKVTGLPTIMDHRVATLGYPSAGMILARHNNVVHMEQLAKYCCGIAEKVPPLDLVLDAIYPFEDAAKKGEVDLLTAVENIDIGGPTLLRAAAKNFEWVVPIPGMKCMEEVIAELRTGKGISFDFRVDHAITTFSKLSRYDAAIANFLERSFIPESI